MKFKVTGSHMHTGEDVEMVIDAATRESANKKAARQSIIVLSVDPEDEVETAGASTVSIFDKDEKEGGDKASTGVVYYKPPKEKFIKNWRWLGKLRRLFVLMLVGVLLGGAVVWVWLTYGSAGVYHWIEEAGRWVKWGAGRVVEFVIKVFDWVYSNYFKPQP